MKLFLGILLGFLLTVGIAAGAAYMAFGDIGDLGERDRSQDVTRNYDFDGFREIDISGVYEVKIEVGSAASINLSGAPEEMDRVEIAVTDGVLKLGSGNHGRTKKKLRNHGITAIITMPELEALDVSGVADVEADNIAASDFDVRLSGVGEIDLSGTCDTLSARVSGVGELDARDLECSTADVRVSGIGEATVYASDAVNAGVSGIGSISVYGTPDDVKKDKGLLSNISIH
ncbi:MAG: DUF2807 domain-containing protein [Marinicaulis sp.]|nr:DUF2807 domain-containing protein [Marinicaulis sp.]NNE41382.1 DUF2807 domain-containing protein [Marinicaulis sp.]